MVRYGAWSSILMGSLVEKDVIIDKSQSELEKSVSPGSVRPQ